MAWDKGFDFRATSGYVTDPLNHTYVMGVNYDPYPTTRNGVTFGWEDFNDGSIDCSGTVDARLAGCNYIVNGGSSPRFRVDLPAAGNYLLRAGFADARGNGWAAQQMVVKDTGAAVHTLAPTAVGGANALDINGTSHTWAAWPANNTSVTKAFASTICRFFVGGPGADYTVLAHLFVSQQAAGGTFQAAWARGANQMIGGC